MPSNPGVRLIRDDRLTQSVDHAYAAVADVPSTLLGVTVRGYPDQLVEVEAVAVIGA